MKRIYALLVLCFVDLPCVCATSKTWRSRWYNNLVKQTQRGEISTGSNHVGVRLVKEAR